MKVKGKIIVVTDGGGGLGRKLVLNLLEKGAKVAIVDINSEALDETIKLARENISNLSKYVLNITDKERVLVFPEEIIKIHGAVDGIINNAGIIQPFINASAVGFDVIECIMNINFYGTLNMAKAFLPYFEKRPEAHIVNISSMGGFIPFPGQTLYGASKAAVKLLTEGLYAELKDMNIKVTVVHPGAINTNIKFNSGLEQSEKEKEEAKTSSGVLQPNEAAKKNIAVIEKDKFRARIGKDAKMLDVLYRIAPKFAVNLITKKNEISISI
ncbi:short-chain dehydrogenase [Labilibaculum manganireducens]|uniref:Short-chain dehydrogenase n=1 Tax=Labilibaculum manganireducens TaxID=1940525 RepID=A0A2N3I6S9_9BACT|nr:SDR family oxidoreductase [Labilibaculum manganireducens]PKQ66005.1 short-chain dehydrogenase [Labilibaculum manganireducens]